jgi:hypothetical protein
VVVEGKDQAHDGLLGFQTRLATLVTHGLYPDFRNWNRNSPFFGG